MRRNDRVVRSAHVLCYWRADDLILHNYATGAVLLATRHHCAVLDGCAEPATLFALRSTCPDLHGPAVRSIVEQLRRHGMVYRLGEQPPAAESAMRTFSDWNPEAGFFHTATRNVNFTGVPDGDSPAAPYAPALKRYSGRPVISLPLTALSGTFTQAVLARRTARRFGRRRLRLAELATLLRLTAGVHASYRSAAGRVLLRTSPSGGARHPLEVYVLAQRTSGLRSGLYHYESDRHRLHLIVGGRRATERYLPGQPWYKGVAAIVFFSAVFARTRARYPYSRAYKAVLIEAGHMAQTFCLSATWLGLAPFCSLALSDDAIDGDLGLDGITESVLYAAGVAAPFDGEAVNMAPANVPQPRLIPNRHFQLGKLRRTHR